MKHFLTTIILLLVTGLFTNSLCQPKVILRIYGHYYYKLQPQSLNYKVIFEEVINKCDPNFGPESMEGKINNFKRLLKDNGFDFRDFKIDTTLENLFGDKRKIKYTYEIQDIDNKREAYNLNSILSTVSTNEVDIYYVFKNQDFTGENNDAVNALKNAMTKANIIASFIGMKVKNVLNIDDGYKDILDLGLESYYFDDEEWDDFSDEEFIKSTTPDISKNYYLIVTFELE